MSENVEQTQTQPQPELVPVSGVLNPVTRKIVERCINEVLMEYVKTTKQFTADSLHYIRVKVTELVKQRLGDDEITSVDIGLDLTKFEDIPFFFKINIPKEKTAEHIIQTQEPGNPPQ